MKVIRLIKRPTTYAVVFQNEYNILGFKFRTYIVAYQVAKGCDVTNRLIAEEVSAWIELNDIPKKNINLGWFAKYV